MFYMETSKISFGQTYIKPSLTQYMAPNNLKKMPYIFGLGEFYPIDIYMGSNTRGQLTLDMIHSTVTKQLFLNNIIPKTIQNISILNFMHNMEIAARKRNGIKTPIFKTTIDDIDNLSIKELQLKVNEKIQKYYENFGKKFLQ